MRSSAYATGLLCARRALPKLGLADKYAGVTEPDGTLQHIEALNEGARLFEFQVLPRCRSIPHVHGKPCSSDDEGCIGRAGVVIGPLRAPRSSSPIPLTRRTLRRSTPTPAIREDPTCKPPTKRRTGSRRRSTRIARLTVVERKEKIQKRSLPSTLARTPKQCRRTRTKSRYIPLLHTPKIHVCSYECAPRYPHTLTCT